MEYGEGRPKVLLEGEDPVVGEQRVKRTTTLAGSDFMVDPLDFTVLLSVSTRGTLALWSLQPQTSSQGHAIAFGTCGLLS